MRDGFDVTSIPTDPLDLKLWMFKVAQDPAAVEVHAERIAQWLRGEGEPPQREAGGDYYRGECARVLGEAALTSQTAVRILIEALTNERGSDHGDGYNGPWWVFVWEEARGSLYRAKENALPLLIAALDDPDSLRRQRVADILRGLGSLAQAAVPALIGRLTDPVREVRVWASYALREICGPNNLVLCALLESPNPEVVYGALAAIDPLPAELVPFCAKLLEHPEARFRSRAAFRLLTARHTADSASPALIHCLNDPYIVVRYSVIAALAWVGREDPDAPAALMRADLLISDNTDFFTGYNTGDFSTGEGISGLKSLRTRAPRFIRMALPELLRLLKDPQCKERGLALDTVQQLELPVGDLPALLHLAESVLAEAPAPRGSRESILLWTLGAIATEEAATNAIPLLERAMTDVSERVRNAAAKTLLQVTQSCSKG